jgi:hypothetical protein
MTFTALFAGAYLFAATPLIIRVTPPSPAVRATAMGALSAAAVLAAISVDVGNGFAVQWLGREGAAALGAISAAVVNGWATAALTRAELGEEAEAFLDEQMRMADSRLNLLAG